MTRCMACSSTIPDGAGFCPSCGAPQESASNLPTTPRSGSPFKPLPGDGERFLPGTILEERYRITGRLGRGGMGEVYRADDLKLGQPVALKFLPAGLENDPDRLQRLLGEVRTARQVSHPNVCRVHDIGETEGQHFLTMEYVDGEDLSSLLRRVGRLPQERAVQVARQICAGLAAAHDRGVLHRDLKPANIMLDGRGQVRITDFGLAALADQIASDDVAIGTPAYMAPEQERGEAVTVQSDLYALGLVLYEVYTGRRAFENTGEDLRARRDRSSISSPSSLVRDLDPAAERAILHCLEQDPQDRPRSAPAVAAALPGGDPLAAALAAGETPSPELVAEARPSQALRPWVALLLAVAAVAVFAGGARWAGSMSYLAYLPMDDPPAVLKDEARTLLEELGYTEPAYSEPLATAWGFLLFSELVEDTRNDSLPDPWADLANRPETMSFWYRQSPRLYRPSANTLGAFTPGLVRPDDPWPRVAGEVIVLLDLSRRLHRLEVLPKRYSTIEDAPPEIDWSPLFAWARLDTTRMTPVRPRYQRFFAPDRRAAWTGTRVEDPDRPLLAEAGSFEGRPVLFQVGNQEHMQSLGADPVPGRLPVLRRQLVDLVFFPLLLLAAWLGRRNLARGRADRRGTMRIGAAFFLLVFFFQVLRSYVLWTPGGFFTLWPILGQAVLSGVAAAVLYLAIEPWGRRIWPSVFVSSNRLLSRPRFQARDPLIGRSVLAGALAGALFPLLAVPVFREAAPILGRETPLPIGIDWDVLVSQRQAVAWSLQAFLTGGLLSVFIAFIIVGGRWLLRRPWASVLVAAAFWTILDQSLFAAPIPAPLRFLLVAGLYLCFLRFGFVALIVATATRSLWAYAVTDSWTAWYGQAAVASLLIFLAVVAYGTWASASSGGHPVRATDP